MKVSEFFLKRHTMLNVKNFFNFLIVFISMLFFKVSLTYAAKGPPFDPPGPPPPGFPYGVPEPTTLTLLIALIIGGTIAHEIVKQK